MPSPTPNTLSLVERLKRKTPYAASYLYGYEGGVLINPDGPEAAAHIEALEKALTQTRNAVLEEAATIADRYAAFCKEQARRQPAEWTSAGETAETIARSIRGAASVISGDGG